MDAWETPGGLSPEADGQLLAAMERIEVVDGDECLDGWRLPPADDEVFDPFPIRLTIHDRATRVVEFDSGLTNRQARESNLGLIARGGWPLYLRAEDIPLRPPRAPVHQRLMQVVRRVL